MHVCSCMCSHTLTWFAHVCRCIPVCEGQRTASCVILWAFSTLLFEDRAIPWPGTHWVGEAAVQQFSGAQLPLQFHGYKHMPLYPTFRRGLWGSDSGSYAKIISPTNVPTRLVII